MPTEEEIKWMKSANETQASGGGGRMSYNEIANQTKYNLFPRVSRSERVNGVTKYKKVFLWNVDTDDEAATELKLLLLLNSPAGDRFYVANGTQIDTISDIDSNYKLKGGGNLNADVTSGGQALTISMKNNDYVAENGNKIIITSHVMTGQTVASNVRMLDPVYYTGSEWITQAPPNETSRNQYPYGTFIDSGKVYSENDAGKEQELTLQNVQVVDESIGSPNGSQTVFNFTLATTPILPGSITVDYTIGSTAYEGIDNGSGAITGTNISSGSIDYSTGVGSITFSTAPDNATALTATYYQQAWEWSGNVMTVRTVEQLDYNFAAANSLVAFAIFDSASDYLRPTLTDVSVVSGTGGTFDNTDVTLGNLGTVEDTWTLTFSSATNFSCSGLYEGSVGTGTISSIFAPINNNEGGGSSYFSIAVAAWGGTFASGDTVTFKTRPAAFPFWVKQVVPAGTEQYSNNGVILYTSFE